MDKHFQYWATLTAFSVVSLSSLLNQFDNQGEKDWSSEQKWVVSVTAISLCLSALACVLHLVVKDMFAAKPIELGWIVTVLGMWCAGLPALMDPDNEFALLAVKGSFPIRLLVNSNLFFSSWGSFITASLLVTSHFQITFNRQDQQCLFHWAGLTIASLVVMVSASGYWKDYDCQDDERDDDNTCSRTMFGVILGLVSAVVGFAMIGFQLENKMVEKMTSFLLLIGWCFGVAYLTYEEGPANGGPSQGESATGILYFAVWFAFFFALGIAAAPALPELVEPASTPPPETEETPANPDAKAAEIASDTKGEDLEEHEEEEVVDQGATV